MRYLLFALWILFGSVPAAVAQLSIGIGVPGVSIGINLPVYPEFVQVPGYPVYYAPRLRSNYFFYDGMYWVYQSDNWYASSWYNGPWGMVGPQYVPVFVLRVPVRYYQQPPTYFLSWQADAPPLWGSYWGNDWEQQRSGWDQWDRRAIPALAPLPVYQQQYLGDRYPTIEQQHELHNQNYRYQPQDSVVQQYYKERVVQKAPAASQQEAAKREQPKQEAAKREEPKQEAAKREQPQQEAAKREEPKQEAAKQEQPKQEAAVREQPKQEAAKREQPQQEAAQREQPQQGVAQREQQTRNSSKENIPQDQEKGGASKEPKQDEEQDRGDKDQERGQGRNK